MILGVATGCGRQQGRVAPEEGTSKGAVKEESTQQIPKESAGEEAVKEESTQEATNRRSLSQAIGQMFIVGMSGTKPDHHIKKMIQKHHIGGVILSVPNIKNLRQTQTLVSKLQKLSMETTPSIPLVIAVDEEGGSVTRAPWIPHRPAAAVVGRSGNPDWAYHIAYGVGQKLKEAGINTNLAPVVDTGFGPAIGDRSFGTDPNPTVPPVRNDLLNTACCTLIEESRGCEDDQATLQDA
jgi:beta-N-acetylhexosaminidase